MASNACQALASGVSFDDAPMPVSWLDGQVARAELMDPGTAQVTPMELCTRLHESATAAGAKTVYGEVTGVQLVGDDDDCQVGA